MKFLSFMYEVNSNNGNETKSVIFPGDIFKCGTMFFYQKIKGFQWLSKSKFLIFMTKVKPNNGNETKSVIFHGTYSNLTSYLFYPKILKCFNDFQNQNFSILWLKRNQAMEMKQNQTFFHGTYSDLTIFFIGCKILKCQFYSKREHKQVKGNKTTPEMCKSDSVFRYLQNGTLFK